ncbi:uncharacterized protein LOC119319619 isoform X1 [Triticum dicoccoides]|uniref:uncharacterized protein LOC119319619 isoform X1 n=1 Tax=Triticum dicoccoides TaxID=85692 RepID=UPI000E796F86|nr:uncharacterized protein LOC119319619 isoform X1 [Triticum dicoccoides]
MRAPAGRRRGSQPRDEAAHFVMSDLALSDDHAMLLHGHGRGESKIYPGHRAVFSANPRAVQGGGANESPRQTRSSCAQAIWKNDAALLPMSAEAKLFSPDGYAGIRNVSGVFCSQEGGHIDAVPAQDDQHKSRESDLLLFDWPELDDLEDLDTDLRKLDSAFELGIDYFDHPMWSSICSPDVQLVPSSHSDNPHPSNVANDQQLSWKKGKDTPLNSSSSSVEIEHFPGLSDADLLCPFDFHDMLVPTSSSVMCNDQIIMSSSAARSSIMCNDESIMSSSAARSGADDLVSAYVSTKNSQPRATPDMILDEMAGNPLEMYFPPLATCEQPQVPMSGTASTLAGDGALNGAAMHSGSNGRRSSGGVRENARPSSVPEAAPVPVRHLGFQKLQEGMNQLDVGTKACIRDALYRLAYSVEQRHQAVEQNVGSSAANRLSTSSVWAETERSPMDRSVAQLLLQKPLDRRTANRAA